MFHGQGRVIKRPEFVLVLTQPGQQTVASWPRDHRVTGREGFGVARQLFGTEQLGSQWRLGRAWARTCLSGHPVLNAQWQSLHIVFASGRDFRNWPASGNSSSSASAALAGGIRADWTTIIPVAVSAQDRPNCIATSVMIALTTLPSIPAP